MAQTENPKMDKTEAKVAVPLHKEGCSIADYRKIVRLGEGTFGEVWKAERGGFPVALKILNKSLNSDDAQRELKSLEMLKKLHHKYLIHTENFWSDGDRLFIEMELADGGTLKDRMKAYQAIGKVGIPEGELLKYFIEAAKALDYMHGHRPVFLHRDIKPHNILLVQGCAKLADFGLLRQVTGDNTSTKTSGGTPVYMAPESITEDKFSVQSDLWSFAVTYAELRQGKLPFVDKTQFNIFKKICQEPPYLSDIFHPDEKAVVLKALGKDPHQRFSSCGEFVFELNRVVPWDPATEIAVLELPENQETGGSSTGVDSRVADPDTPPASEFGTSRKRSPTTMPDYELPPLPNATGSAPTLSKQDGTVIGGQERRSSPLPSETAKKPRTDQGTDKEISTDWQKSTPPAPSPIEKKFDTVAPAPRPQRPDKAGKRSIGQVFLSILILGILAGIGGIVYLAVTSKEDPSNDKPKDKGDIVSAADIENKVAKALEKDNLTEARDLVEKNKTLLDKRATTLLKKIDDRKKILDVFTSAKALLNQEDYLACLALIKTAGPFELSEDNQRRDNLKRSAENGRHEQLVGDVRKQIRKKDSQQLKRISAALVTLKDFRSQYPRPDWTPDFKEMPLPKDLVTAAWNALLDKKIDVAECRTRFTKLQTYSNPTQPDQYVLDPAYETNLKIIEALIKAHEADGNSAPAALDAVTTSLREPGMPTELTRNIWLALANLDKRFRVEDLETLPAALNDDQAKSASQELFAKVLERLIKSDNSSWLPSKKQSGQIAGWIPRRTGEPTNWLRALQAECLVRSGGDVNAIDKSELKKLAGWYGAYVVALAEHHNAVLRKDDKQKEGAAETLVALFASKPIPTLKPVERVGQCVAILRDAVRTLPRTDGDFATKASAEKGFRWLTLVLQLLDNQVQASGPDELADLALAAVKSEAPKAGDILKMVATRLDKLPQADKAKGYLLLARAFHNDLDHASASLEAATAKNDIWDKANLASKRAQVFAYALRSIPHLKPAAELNAKAVTLEANVVSARTAVKAPKLVMYRVFDSAIKKAKAEGPKKELDAFILPVVVGKLGLGYVSANVLEPTIDEARAVLIDLTLPNGEWWELQKAMGLGRMADRQLDFVRVNNKTLPQAESIRIRKEMLNSYKIAKEKKCYQENYSGELAVKVAFTLYYLYKNDDEFKGKVAETRKRLLEAKSQLSANKRPYLVNGEDEIKIARSTIDLLLSNLNK